MSFPDGVQSVTLTAGAAGYRTLDGEPYQGVIRLTPSVSRVVSEDHGVIALGPVNITVGASGQFTETVLATDAAGFQPSGWTYRVDEEFTNAPSRAYSVGLPAAVQSVALAELTPVSASDGSSVWTPPGGTAASSTVTTATTFGLSSAAGSSAEYSRGDHAHGTPPAPTVGTSAGTYAAGDDARITGAAQKAASLSDLASASSARSNLGLGGAATLSVGTSSGTVAAGDDGRIVGAAQKSQNLADLGSAATARTNLGLGGAAVLSVGTAPGTVAAGDDSRLADARTPVVHAASHATGGGDPVSPGSIGAAAASDLTSLSGTVSTIDVFVNDCLSRVAAIEQGTAYLNGGHFTAPVDISEGGLTVTSSGTAILIVNRGTTSNFGGFALETGSSECWAVQMLNNGTNDLFVTDTANGVNAIRITPSPTTPTVTIAGVAAAGSKNGLTGIRLAGFKATSGAPTTGTWVAGDVVLDSAGVWHLCTAGGTPGTWT